ncbi:DUF938 domain-containing protein [Mesorhizobium sp. NBSH29]|uniref:DUF938 domain-containing protein n=1 Tax=Mesorhizobium sp. NBSH29 TaxID=2654249 RepID=UPI00189695E2|nr:DUF938 domain-containing protein [Mesorhizobium sp. NBSH29]QPC88473.1 DUF938 domain-containing protein [Mesorhizobium sp. NBSH29]
MQALGSPDVFPPSAMRNRDPILGVLREFLPADARVLEIASGSGAHALHAAAQMPHWTWQPTEIDAVAVDALTVLQRDANLPNLLAPLLLDASKMNWPVSNADAIVAVNMIHIAPWTATKGLFCGATRLLECGGLLYLYGPFEEDDRETLPGNVAFNQSLKQRNPEWGLRNLSMLRGMAGDSGFEQIARIEMPANNLSVIFRRC